MKYVDEEVTVTVRYKTPEDKYVQVVSTSEKEVVSIEESGDGNFVVIQYEQIMKEPDANGNSQMEMLTTGISQQYVYALSLRTVSVVEEDDE